MRWLEEGRIIEFPARGEFSEKLLDDRRDIFWWEEGVLFMWSWGNLGPQDLLPPNPSPGKQKPPGSRGSDPACLNIFTQQNTQQFDVYLRPIPWIYLDLM